MTEYAKLADQFHPDKFDPDAWAAIAKSAGMKYTVLTARHHDGFALFDDPGSNFTAMKSAAHHDFVADYVAAIRKAGLHVGLYYSPLDWRFPGFYFPDLYRANADELREQYHRQLNELATHYGKLDILWFDGGGEDWLGFGGVNFKGHWQARPVGTHYTGSFSWQDDEAIDNLRKEQPSILINDRTDAPADFLSREGDSRMGDFRQPASVGALHDPDGGAWGYQKGARLKTLSEVLHLLVGAVGRRWEPAAQRGAATQWPDRAGAGGAAARGRRIGCVNMGRASTPRVVARIYPATTASRPITTARSICISSILLRQARH